MPVISQILNWWTGFTKWYFITQIFFLNCTYINLVEYFVSILPFHISPLSCPFMVISPNIFIYASETFENSITRLLSMFKKIS